MNANLYIITGTTPQNLTGDFTFNTAVFWGYSAFNGVGVPTANTGSVYIGVENNKLPAQIPTGSYFNWTLSDRRLENTNNFWVKGGIGDGVYVICY